MEMIIGECLENSRHTTRENKELFKALKRGIKTDDETEGLKWSKVLISQIGSALAEQHEGIIEEEEADDEED